MKPLIGMAFATLAAMSAQASPPQAQASPLRGTWTLVAADKILPGGEQVRDYGQTPKGRLIVDAQGRYSLQIFKSERLRFAGDKNDGSADEFASAALGSSTHYGTVSVDAEQGILVFRIEGASYPNWEGVAQKRTYTLEGGVLSYRVPVRPDGSVPISVWRKID
ncbi:lipocalin-like domain-containing protein [Luteimonas gilva]|uniref:Lipocalin-like domain-containing protein n=1 Tax=Luteimonas gilva TaxID=2572684 RepID=A0A4U5JP43_9GAMM|nr:lipocalin-like domain-containing protein [Luteimonas gilva]TKR30576.1 lipocalin-like domain-containing protein [Luteimonas gilva]